MFSPSSPRGATSPGSRVWKSPPGVASWGAQTAVLTAVWSVPAGHGVYEPPRWLCGGHVLRPQRQAAPAGVTWEVALMKPLSLLQCGLQASVHGRWYVPILQARILRLEQAPSQREGTSSIERTPAFLAFRLGDARPRCLPFLLRLGPQAPRVGPRPTSHEAFQRGRGVP